MQFAATESTNISPRAHRRTNFAQRFTSPDLFGSGTYTWRSARNNMTFADGAQYQTVDVGGGRLALPFGASGGFHVLQTHTIRQTAGQQMTVTVNVSVPAAGTFASTGHGTFNSIDTNTPNNTFNVTINAK